MNRTYCLIVDNHPEHQELAAMVVEDLGLETGTCEQDHATWNRIITERPSVLVIDLEVGNEIGWELLDQIHQETETRTTPVICLSTDQELLTRAESACPFPGGSRYLQKPYDIQELEDAVLDLLPGAQGVRRNAGAGNLSAE